MVVGDLHVDDQDRQDAKRLDEAVRALEAGENAGSARQMLGFRRGDCSHAASDSICPQAEACRMRSRLIASPESWPTMAPRNMTSTRSHSRTSSSSSVV